MSKPFLSASSQRECFLSGLNVPMSDQLLLDCFFHFKGRFQSVLQDYYPEESSGSGVVLHHPPKDEFLKMLPCPLGFDFDDVRFVESEGASLFIHKDRRMQTRLGKTLLGSGICDFYEAQSGESFASCDFKTWTLIDTQVFHGVKISNYRVSIQFGFQQPYREVKECLILLR